MTTRWKSIVGGLAAAAAVAIAAVGITARPVAATTPPSEPPGSTSADGRTITVSATGTVRVEPDTAVVNLGVQANALTSAEAMEQVNASSAALTEALIGAGIAEEDIQTTGLSLWPTTDDRGEINGYQASLSIDVTVRDITTVGQTIDSAQQSAGEAFTISGVSFSFADPEAVLEQARIDAVTLARTKAEQYAAALGVTVGDVFSITEHSSTPPIIFSDAERATATVEEAGPAISPGQIDLRVDVTVTYSLVS
jgi:uncharacterized protein YggE